MENVLLKQFSAETSFRENRQSIQGRFVNLKFFANYLKREKILAESCTHGCYTDMGHCVLWLTLDFKCN